jgi:hypothetical protein
MANSPTDAEIQDAFDRGFILRTHVMRPTWHFVAGEDIHWMRELTAPRIRQAISSYDRKFGLSPAIRSRAIAGFERAFRHHEFPTRAELGTELKRAGLEMKGVQLELLTIHAEIDGLLCSGPRRGKNLTYALLEARAPIRRRLDLDEALAQLTRRYFRSHGPATIRDFVWWSGLTTSDAKRGLEMNQARCDRVDDLEYWFLEGEWARSSEIYRALHLLPVLDEYIVAYRDRDSVSKMGQRPGGLTSQNALVIGGRMIGLWKTVPKTDGLSLEVAAWKRLSKSERDNLAEAAANYGKFLGVSVSLAMPAAL